MKSLLTVSLSRCGMCAAGHLCKATCARSLFCSHLCGRACHDGKECEPCEEKCQRACNHSVCPRQCCDPVSHRKKFFLTAPGILLTISSCCTCFRLGKCSSCVEPCDWICEHKGQCPLVCGAPCSRLPCNEVSLRINFEGEHKSHGFSSPFVLAL
jgi:hypothetical protein